MYVCMYVSYVVIEKKKSNVHTHDVRHSNPRGNRYIHTCTHTHTHTHAHTHKHTHTHTHSHTLTRTHVHAHTRTHTGKAR